MDNYEVLDTGVIKQINYKMVKYDYTYSNKYSHYGEKTNYMSHLRFGVLMGVLKRFPTSIVDVGYGNGSFLKLCKENIDRVYGCDVSDYPIPEGCKKIEFTDISNVDVTCFFDSLEHFEDIDLVKRIDTQYIFISVPWCHNLSDEWFLNWHHRRENEHLWHFNDKSIVEFFKTGGYTCIYLGSFEDVVRKNTSLNGLPNILSCVFKRCDK